MKDITFYDFDFNRLGDFHKCISLNFTKNYCGYGTAELHFSLSASEVIELLEGNPYVFFVSEGRSAIVTGWMIDTDIAIFARTPEWLLTKRGVEPISRTSVTPEVIARDAVLSAAGDFLVLGDLQGLGTAQDYSTDKIRILHDVVCEVLNTQKLGFEVVLDIAAKQFTFRVYNGSEKPVLLSRSNRTAYDTIYTVEKQDAVTGSGWYERKFTDMGEWDSLDNSPKLTNKKESNFFKFYKITGTHDRFNLDIVEGEYIYCDTSDGVWKTSDEKPDREWVYIDNPDMAGAKKWDAVLSGTKTEAEAVAEISQLIRDETFSSKARHTVYGTDYNLGDIVGVHLEVGNFRKSEKKRVTSVNIYYDINNVGVTPILSSLEE